MKAMLKEFFISKRVFASIVGVLSYGIAQVANAKMGLNVDPTAMGVVLAPFVAYVLGKSYEQGQQPWNNRYTDPRTTLERVAIGIADDPFKREPDEITAELAAYKGALGG